MVVAPGRMIGSFLSIPDAESLPLYRMVLKLACACARTCSGWNAGPFGYTTSALCKPSFGAGAKSSPDILYCSLMYYYFQA
jgi:hypothetical protein